MDFITGQGGGAQTNSKVRNLASSLITVLFSLYVHRQVYLISQRVAVFNPYAQINLPIGKGKTDRKSRCEQLQPEESQNRVICFCYSTMGISTKLGPQ